MPRELTDWSHDPEAATLNRETREAMEAEKYLAERAGLPADAKEYA